MTKFRGSIGINRGSKETAPGVYESDIEEIEVTGDIRNIRARWPNMTQRDSVSVRHFLSIVTPEDSIINFTEAVYVVWQGRKWSVAAIQYKRPRVELTLGALYHG